MLHYFTVFYRTYHNGELIGTYVGHQLTENILTEESYDINWKNLDEMYYKYGLCLKMNVFNTKKGHIVEFYNGNWIKGVLQKEKNKKPLNVTFKISYEEKIPSIQTILNWNDGEKAIKYLIERGISINKIID